MPASPRRTKKALQEVAKVFNKLASEFAADLNEAVREIENLRHEVQRLKTSSGRSNKTSSSQKRAKPVHATRSTRGQPSTSHQEKTHGHHETPHEAKSSQETGSFVFPHEPFNPPAPPEPTAPGNN
jgi:Skp family chaperone for outer membrane proteins